MEFLIKLVETLGKDLENNPYPVHLDYQFSSTLSSNISWTLGCW
jgi:hypothetical protein